MPYSRHHFQGMKWRREGRGEENRKGEGNRGNREREGRRSRKRDE